MTSEPTFAEFYAEAFASNLRYLRRRFAISSAMAEDIVQTALMHLWEKNPTLAGINNPYTYFRSYLEYDALNQLRRLPKDAPLSIDRVFLYDDADDAQERDRWTMRHQPLSVEDTALLHIQLAEAQQVLGQLSDVTQLVMQMSVAGYDAEEIHEHFQVHCGMQVNVKNRLAFARQRLRTQGYQYHALKRAKRQQTTGSGAWARNHTACVICGTTEFSHAAHGRCEPCYDAERLKGLKQGTIRVRPKHQWAAKNTACIQCGSTQHPHKVHGLCWSCYEAGRRAKRAAQKQARLAHVSS